MKKLRRASGCKLRGLTLMSWMIWWGLMEGRRRLRGLSSAVLMAVEIVEIMGSLISGG